MSRAKGPRRSPLLAGPACCYSACTRPPDFTLYLAFRAEHGGERRVPVCAHHAALLTLNDEFRPGATFAGQDIADRGPWDDYRAADEAGVVAGGAP